MVSGIVGVVDRDTVSVAGEFEGDFFCRCRDWRGLPELLGDEVPLGFGVRRLNLENIARCERGKVILWRAQATLRSPGPDESAGADRSLPEST
jgi:hypothetical protein